MQRLDGQRRPGQPRSNREGLLRRRVAAELGEYRSGFWIPDISDESNVEKLRGWNEEWTSLGTLMFVRVSDDGQSKPSAFPPKGQS